MTNEPKNPLRLTLINRLSAVELGQMTDGELRERRSNLRLWVDIEQRMSVEDGNADLSAINRRIG